MSFKHQPAWIRWIEHLGNRLPHPTLLFVWLCLALLAFSAITAPFNLSALHPETGELIKARSLFGAEGIRFMLTHMVSNFTGFAPLGIVLVAMLAIGIAEHSGLIGNLLERIVRHASSQTLIVMVALAGVLSSMAADAGYVVLIPLAATLFIVSGRSPLLGIATAFAAVSGGFSANLLIGPVDALLAGISTEAAQIYDTHQSVHAADNYWFIVASTGLVVAVVSAVSIWWLQPRLDHQPVNLLADDEDNTPYSSRGLMAAALVLCLYGGLLLMLTLPEHAVLRDPVSNSLLHGPFMDSIVILIALAFALCGLAYGYASGRFKHGQDVVLSMENTMSHMAGYLVLMFFAAQFVAWFQWSQLGLILAIEGAALLQGMTLPAPLLVLCFIFMTAGINLFIGSASAKWALLAPIFVPVMLALGVAPEATQAAYRVGDSSTNIITPLMPYFALVLGFMRRYQEDAGVGTLASLMLPYSLALLLLWSALLTTWVWLGWPLGPG